MKKINKTKIIVLAVILLVIFIVILGVIVFPLEQDISMQTQDIQAKYYVVQQEYQYGVIDTRRELSS